MERGKLRSRVLLGTVALAVAAAATTAVTAPASAAPGPDHAGHGYTPPKIGHVWTIVLENKSYEATFTGLNQNDYLWKTLPSYGLLMRQYYGTSHYSLGNYTTAVSGQAPAPDLQADCPQFRNVAPGFPAPDGQTYASTGCVYPKSVPTLFNQLDARGISWKGYMQDMGNDPGREDPTCGEPGDPTANGGQGVPAPGGATPTDQYVAKHNPFIFFHSVLDSPQCKARVVPLAGGKTATGRPVTGLEQDLRSIASTPGFSWITPNNCQNAHDATCKGDNGSGDPNNHQGGLYAADNFLKKYIPLIMQSPAFQRDGLIQIVFDEAFPPYKMYGNSIADYTGNSNPALNTPTDTAQSVVACCNELPGPNTTQPGFQAFGQDTTPGGGITGAVFISRFIRPGSVTDQPYNHYSWLRSTEDLFGIRTGGVDGRGHLGYAGQYGLRPFGPDVYNNVGGRAYRPAPSGSSVYPASAAEVGTAVGPRVVRPGVPVPLGGR